MTPRIQLIAYESRNPAKIFVAIPDQRGRYILTDRSVAMVPCEHCKSMVGEPCKSRLGYSGGTHYTRRNAIKRISPKPHAPDVTTGMDEREAETTPVDDWPTLEQP